MAEKKRGDAKVSASIGWKTAIALLAKVAIALIVFWFALWLAVGDSVAYSGYLNALGFVFCLAAFVAALILLWRRSFIWAGAGLLVAATLFTMGSGLNLGAGEQRVAGKVRVVSASLRGLNEDMASAAERLAGYNADIIALQEVRDASAFRAELGKLTKAEWNMVADGPYAVLSKSAVVPSAQQSKNWDGVTVYRGPMELTLWNLHAPKSFANPIENSAYYVDLIDAVRVQRPDLVVGDFNATPWNYGYRLVARDMNEAHAVAGFGPGNSFPARGRRMGLLGAFSRLDHIFVAPRHDVANAFTGYASRGSDHHPVVADVEFRAK